MISHGMEWPDPSRVNGFAALRALDRPFHSMHSVAKEAFASCVPQEPPFTCGKERTSKEPEKLFWFSYLCLYYGDTLR